MSNITKSHIITNFLWRYVGKTGTQVVSLVVTIILARIITPEAFGEVAIVLIFTTLLQAFVNCGLGSALIQREDVDAKDFSTVFYFNIVSSIILYAILFFTAPFIAQFYNNIHLIPLLRVASCSLIITGLRSTQETYVTRYLLFKKHFIAFVVASLLSSIIAVIMAYKGFGAWAIVGQQLLNTAICTFLLWCLIPWRPLRFFSMQRLKVLLPYGIKLLGASLADTLYSEIRSLLIGKAYTSKDLAYYNQGKTIPYVTCSGLNQSLNSILFPVLSRFQGDRRKMNLTLRKSISLCMFYVSSLMSCIFCCADSMTEVLLTDKWLPSVIYMRILCFDALFWPLTAAHMNQYKAMGRSDICFKNVIFTKVVGVFLLIVTIPIGTKWVAVSSVVATLFQSISVMVISKKLNEYYYIEQIKDLLYALIPSFLIFVFSWWWRYVQMPSIICFFIQIFLSGAVFCAYGIISKNEYYLLIKDFLINKLLRYKSFNN